MKEQNTKCELPPKGWECSRTKGHDGPCAATPTGTGEHRESPLVAVLAALPTFHPAKAEYAELEIRLAEAESDAANLRAIQDFGADYDIYAEAGGKWSIRERTGDRALFDNVGECASALRNLEARKP